MNLKGTPCHIHPPFLGEYSNKENRRGEVFLCSEMQYGDMTGVLMQCIFANTPVVSPESKNPALAGLSNILDCRFLSLPSGAALPSMNGLSDFLGGFQ